MRYEKVKMVVEFIVPIGEEHYGPRTTQAHWKRYAEHDMLEQLKDIEDIPEIYRETADRWSQPCAEISFVWLGEFEKT